MIASAHATVAPDGVLARVRSEPPLTLRQVRPEHDGTCALCLVSSAAGPLASDTRTLRLKVLAGARAVITAAGAQLAQGRDGGAPSLCRTELELGERATLRGDTGPLIVATGSATRVEVTMRLGARACLHWREVVVLGRSGEPPGRARISWDVVRAGRPLLRQTIDLAGEPRVLLAGRRVIASALLAGPGIVARTIVGHSGAVAARLAEDAVLVTALAADAARATADLDALCGAVLARAEQSAAS